MNFKLLVFAKGSRSPELIGMSDAVISRKTMQDMSVFSVLNEYITHNEELNRTQFSVGVKMNRLDAQVGTGFTTDLSLLPNLLFLLLFSFLLFPLALFLVFFIPLFFFLSAFLPCCPFRLSLSYLQCPTLLFFFFYRLLLFRFPFTFFHSVFVPF